MTKTDVADVSGRNAVTRHGAGRGDPSVASRRDGQTFLVAALTGLGLWAAFPPVGASLLAWVVPAGWIWLVRLPELRGRRPYVQLYLAGAIYNLLLIQWVRLPHWSAYFGWWALSAYLACYLPLFVALTRLVTRQWKLPLYLAAPSIWVGLELVRGHLLTGFSMQLLGHTQVHALRVIQMADVFGAYGVSFALMWVAACVACLLPVAAAPRVPRWKPLLLAALMLGGVLAYGGWQLAVDRTDGDAPKKTVALIQGSIDTTFEADNRGDALRQYYALTGQAIRKRPDVDLVVWPESMYAHEWLEFVEPFSLPEDSPLRPDELQAIGRQNEATSAQFAAQLGVPVLVGSPGRRYVGQRVERYNSAVWLSPTGEVLRYNKMHPVLFGEYVPGGDWFPWLYRLTPMSTGLTPGRTPVALSLGNVTLCPHICFENTVPHLLRRQVRQLTAADRSPDVLVTITNDGWFWGSSLLDAHLTCGIFRAVELRRPLLIAANTGFSASIDAEGRVLSQGPRREPGIVWATVGARLGATSRYERHGDWAAGGCALLCLLAAATWLLQHRPPSRHNRSN